MLKVSSWILSYAIEYVSDFDDGFRLEFLDFGDAGRSNGECGPVVENSWRLKVPDLTPSISSSSLCLWVEENR